MAQMEDERVERKQREMSREEKQGVRAAASIGSNPLTTAWMWLGANEGDGRNRKEDGIRDRDAAALKSHRAPSSAEERKQWGGRALGMARSAGATRRERGLWGGFERRKGVSRRNRRGRVGLGLFQECTGLLGEGGGNESSEREERRQVNQRRLYVLDVEAVEVQRIERRRLWEEGEV